MDQQQMTDAPAWPEMSTDLTTARSVARTITLDTKGASNDGRIIDLGRKLDQVTGRLDLLEQDALDNRVAAEVAEQLTSEFATIRREIGTTRAEFDQLSHRVSSTEEDLSTSMLQTIDGFEQRISRIEDARLNEGDDVDEVMAILESAIGRVDDLDARIANIGEDQFRSGKELLEQLETIRAEVTELRSAPSGSDPSPVLEHHAETLDAHTDQLDTIAQDIQFLRAHAADDARLSDVETLTNEAVSLVADVAIRVDQQHESLTTSNAALEASGEQLADIEGQVASAHEKIDEHHDDVVAVQNRLHDVDGTVQGIHHRIDGVSGELHDRVTGQQERIDDVYGTLDHVHGRIDEHQGSIDQLHGRIDELAASHHSLSAETADISESARNDLSGRIEDMNRLVDAGTERVGALEQTTLAIHARIDELAETSNETRSTEFEKYTIRLDDISERAVNAEKRVDSLAETATTSETKVDELSERIDVARARLAEQESATSDLRDELAETTSVLSKQIAQLQDAEPATSSMDASLDEERLTTLEASVEQAERAAVEAHSFSENLRKLQTDLVQAIQTEINTQKDRLAETEAKLEDALRTIAQLSDLQSRSTSVDAQLNDSVVTTNEHVEATNAEMSNLQAQLRVAMSRIDELENGGLPAAPDPRLAALAGESPDPRFAELAGVAPSEGAPEPEDAPAHAIGDLVGLASEDDVDQDDWFVASYAKKRFRRG